MLRPITKSVVFHHSVTPQDWDQRRTLDVILRSHKDRGLAYDNKISYHYLIGHDWTYEGRPLNTVGYHAGNWATNLSSVAICFVGNFNEDILSKHQKQELKRLTSDLNAKYGTLKRYLHRDIKPTACPGANVTHDLIDGIISDMEEQLKAQVRRLQEESRKLTQMVRDGEQREAALKDKISELSAQRDEEIKAKLGCQAELQTCLDRPDNSEEVNYLRSIIQKVIDTVSKVK